MGDATPEAIPVEVESLDAVPEAYRGAYVQDGDRWRLTLEPSDDVGRLKDALRKERELHRAAAAKLARLERQAKQDVQHDAADDPRVAALRRELEEYQQRVTQLEGDVTRTRAETRLREAALMAGVAPKHLPAIMRLIEGRYEVRDGDIVFLGADGQPIADDAPKFFSKRLQAEYPWAYGTPAVGAGSPRTTTSGVLTRESLATLTPEEIRARWSEVKQVLGK